MNLDSSADFIADNDSLKRDYMSSWKSDRFSIDQLLGVFFKPFKECSLF